MGQSTPFNSATGASPPATFRDDTGVQEYLEGFAAALTAGDGKAIAGLWEVPAIVISDGDALAVGSLDEVEKFFAGAKDQYAARGVTDTRPMIVRQQWATDRIALVEVRWPWIGAKGEEVGAEVSTYTLRRDDQGQLKMRAVVMHGAMT